jgi:hypothetical protein
MQRVPLRLSPARLVALVSLVVFLVSLPLVGATRRFQDYVPFDGDMLYYQFQAVNVVRGHGFQIGAIEPFAEYRFDRDDREKPIYRQLEGKAHAYLFGHVPGYQLFVAGVYSVFGVHPRVVYMVQAILLALLAGLLPLIGAHYWGGRGVLSGCLAAALLVFGYLPNPATLMTEPVFAVTLVLAALPFVLIERRTGAWVALLSGTLFGLVFLVKTITALVPPLFLVLALWRIRGARRIASFVAMFVLGFSLFVVPWSAYATLRNDFPRDADLGIIVATQGHWVILDGNNEGSLHDGLWHPEWRRDRAGDPAFFYNRPEGGGRSSLARVAGFWWLYRGQVPALFGRKLARAFGSPRFLALVVAALAFYAWAWMPRLRRRRPVGAAPPPVAPLFPLVLLASLAAGTLVMYAVPRVVLAFAWPLLLIGSRLAVAAGEAAWGLARRHLALRRA